jgi:hypothetical protein
MLVLGLMLAAACSKDVPPGLKAVPADTDVVASVDARALITFGKNVMQKVVPGDMKDQIPTFEALTQQAMQLAGFELHKLTRLTAMGSLSRPNDLALIAEGLTAADVKGEKRGEHQGLALYQVSSLGITYVELPGLGLVTSENEAMLKKVVDTFQGKQKGIRDTERGKVLERLLGAHKELDQVRVYLLTGALPDMGPIKIKMEGGGFFMHLDKGAVAMLLSDKAGASDVASKANMGLMATQAALAMGGGKDMGIDLDKESQKTLTDALGKLRVQHQEDTVALSFTGDLKPLVEKAMALGIKVARMVLSALPAGEDE